jgi:hypothetical protein
VEAAATELQVRFETAVLEQRALHDLACKGELFNDTSVTVSVMSGSWGSSASVMKATGWPTEESWFDSCRRKGFSVLCIIRTVSGPIQPAMGARGSFPWGGE